MRNIVVRFSCIAIGLLVAFGCSSAENDECPSTLIPKPKGNIAPPDVFEYCKAPIFKYDIDGHQYTTFIIAKLAGLNDKRAYTLTYYSQYPDIDLDYAATTVGVRYFFVPWRWDWREDIMAVLHSLHGQKGMQIKRRRQVLANVVSDRLTKTPNSDWQTGMVIHALGDAYSHTYGKFDSDEEEAYGDWFGHSIQGHSPDIIARSVQREKYISYITQLYKAFSAVSGGGDDIAFDSYKTMVNNIKTEKDQTCPHTSEEIVNFARGSALVMLDENKLECMNESVRNLSEKEVQDIIDSIKKEL